MKKTLLVLSMALLLGTAAFADHPSGSLGVGLVAVGNYGDGGVGGQVGLNLKLRDIPIYWGAHLSASGDYLSIGVTGDKLFTDETLLREKGFRLDWFLGLGGYADLSISKTMNASLGARLPLGLSWHATKEFEVWLDLAPSLGISLSPFHFPQWSVPLELGVRAWLK